MKNWPKEDKYDKAIKYVLFLLWPIGSFFYSLRRIKTKSSYRIFFLVALLFGVSLTTTRGKTAEMTMDSAAYREKFIRWFGPTFHRYMDGLQGFLTFDTGKKDYYFETVAYLVSRITHNYHVLFFIFAFVFAFFALKSFRFLTREDKFTFSLSCFILAYIFMYKQIFSINGVRFWTAYWIGVYCVFQLVRNKDKRYILLALLTPFVHGAFWVFLAVMILAYFLKRYEKTWIVLFVISFFVSSISIELIRNTASSLPPFLARFAENYTSMEKLKEIENAGSGFYWVSRLFSTFVRIYMNILVYLFIKNSNLIKGNLKTKNLYLFLLVWMTFSNFTTAVPSLGGRFIQLSYPIIAYIWLVNFKGVKYQRLLYAMPFIFIMSFYRQFNHYVGVLEPRFFISNPFSLVYHYLIAYTI